jgi:acyl carrier protein
MEKQEILNQLTGIFREVFQNPAITINPGTDASEIDEWDSLNHSTLVSKVEKHFNIRFRLSEMLNFKNVGNMCDAIEKKVNG